MTVTSSIRSLVGSGRTALAAGAWDGLSAATAATAGFDCLFVSGFAVSASLGLPDADLYSRGDMTTACWQIPAGTPVDQYLVRKRFNIQPSHAVTLIRALLEHLYGQPGRDLYTNGGPWTYRFDSQDVVVNNAAKCSDVPFGGETVSFANTPLTNVRCR